MREDQQDRIDKKLKIISYGETIKNVFTDAGSYALTRVLVASGTFGAAIVLGRLGNTAAAAGPFMTTINYAISGTVRGFLMSTGMDVGELHGKEQFVEIGKIVRRYWLIGAGLSFLIVLPIYLNVQRILERTGISEEIAESAQGFFTGLLCSLPALFWVPTDIQLALGVKKRTVTLIAGSLYSIMMSSFGFTLALVALGTEGLGFGVAAAAWIMLFGLRIYLYTDPSFEKYELYKLLSSNNRKNFTEIFKQCFGDVNWKDFIGIFRRGFALAIQNLAEWGNLLILSIMGGVKGKEIAVAQAISVQTISAFNVLLSGFAQGVGSRVANYLGATKKYLEKRDFDNAKICRINARRFANVGIVVGFSASVIANAVCIGLAHQIMKLLAGSDDDNESFDYEIAFQLLLINSLGLLADSVRNIGTSILIGDGDVWFPILCSLFIMSGICVPAGGLLALVFNLSPLLLYITRDIGIVLSALCILARWLFRDSHQEKTALLGNNSRHANEISRDHSINSGDDNAASSEPERKRRYSSSPAIAFFNCCPRDDIYQEIEEDEEEYEYEEPQHEEDEEYEECAEIPDDEESEEEEDVEQARLES